MFSKFILDLPTNLFEQLAKSTKFENIANGRHGANLIDYKNDLIPLVRTTTDYRQATQKFLPLHYDIMDNIKKISKCDNLEFNNAMIEIYDSKYRNMKYHSDQAIDLADNSYICIFSCYSDPATKKLRKLKIKNKMTGECSDIILEHNSIIIFSTETNRKHLHKIILEQNNSDNLWLGITFRKSKTFISFNDGRPYFIHSKQLLVLAEEKQKKEFFKCRSQENANIDYNYPEINFTVSTSDLMPITN